jgi:hypothetical protein
LEKKYDIRACAIRKRIISSGGEIRSFSNAQKNRFVV